MRLRTIWTVCILLPASLSFVACTHRGFTAETLNIPHPDDTTKKVEAFLQKPDGKAPWPTVILLHGYQTWPSHGGRDFVEWGVLDKLARRGYLAVAVSEPGYGNSSGPPDFCGAFTQNAVRGIIAKLIRTGYVSPNKIVIEGVSRGALVAGLIAASDSSLAGIVLISGLYDLQQFTAAPKSASGRQIVSAIQNETGGGDDALRARSVLERAQNIKAATLILGGAKDDRTDPEQGRRLGKQIASYGGRSRVIIYPEYGHHIPLEVREREIDSFIDSTLRK